MHHNIELVGKSKLVKFVLDLSTKEIMEDLKNLGLLFTYIGREKGQKPNIK